MSDRVVRTARAGGGSLLLLALLASPALAAAGGEGGGAGEIVKGLVNLALLLGVIVYLGRKPILAFLEERRGKIQEDLDGATQHLQTAEARHRELQRKLQQLDQELAGIRETARQRARDESERLLADARSAADRIRADARVAVAQETERARQTLHDEAARLALELAAQKLREQVTDADRDRLLDEFIARIESGDAAGPSGPGRH